MPEKCALSHGSGVLGRDPRDSCRFWSPHVEKVCTVTQFRLGEGGGGGGDTIGGGWSANREPGSYMHLQRLSDTTRKSVGLCKMTHNISEGTCALGSRRNRPVASLFLFEIYAAHVVFQLAAGAWRRRHCAGSMGSHSEQHDVAGRNLPVTSGTPVRADSQRKPALHDGG